MRSKSRRWLLGLGLVIIVSTSGMAQHGKHHGDGHRGDGGHRESKVKSDYRHSGKGDVAQRVYRVTDADSAQRVKMKPAVDRASKRLEALRQSYHKQEKQVLDSLSLQVKPYLKEEQAKRLTEWREKTERK
jgi:hypothetical protein